jgi:hypothetical protein
MSRDIFQTIITNNKIMDNNINLTFEKDKFNKNVGIKAGDFSSKKDSNKNKYESNLISTTDNFNIEVKQNNIKNLF